MNIRLILFLILLPSFADAACNCGSTNSASPCTGQSISVTVDATITPTIDNVYSWAFNSGGGDARCGQFANGDYWVAPASGQSTVTITAITSSSHASLIKADADPTTEITGVLGGANNYGNYVASENIIPNLPISYSGINSLVAAIQRNETTEDLCGTSGIEGLCVDSYHVVTVLSSVPENAGSTVLRPNITGTTKELISLSDLDLTKIPSKTFLVGTDAAGLEHIRKRWSHSIEIFAVHNDVGSDIGYCSEGGRAFRSASIIDDYGAGMAATWYNDLMRLFSDDHTIEEKTPALAAMLSFGLDLYKTMFEVPTGYVREWGTGATQHPGRFMPTVLLGALMNNPSIATDLTGVAATVHDNIYSGPSEMAQIHDGANGPVWGDVPALGGVNFLGSYWGNLMVSRCWDGHPDTCTPSIGSKNMYDPHGYIDGPPNYPGTSYIGSSLGGQRAMAAAMIIMPQLRPIVNYESLFEYVFRVDDHGVLTSPDPCVTPDSRENFATCDPYRNTGCTYYGVTWGPVGPTNTASECITTPTGAYTKQGRFLLRDGYDFGSAYTASQVESQWTTIRALYQGITRAVSLTGPGSVSLNGAGALTIQ